MTSTTPPDPAQQPAPADGTPTSPGTPNTADATGAPAPSTASDDQAAAAPTAPKRAPRSTTPRAAGTAKAPAKRPSTPRTRTTSASETSGESGDATTPAPKATTARSTTARTSAAKTTATKSTTARTTAAKRTPAKSAAAAGGAEGTESAETTTAPKTPRSTTARPAAAKPATKAAGAKTTTARTSTTKSTTARTPAKRTPARTSAAKQTEQTAAAVAGVLDEVSAPGSVDRATTPAPSEQPSPEVVDRIAVDEPRSDDTQTETPTTASSTAEQAADDIARTTAPTPSESLAPSQEEAAALAAAPKRPVGRSASTPSSATSSPAATTAQRGQTVDDGVHPVVLSISGLVKQFGDTVAVDGVDLEVRRGSFYGIVGPNGAGKTTTLSMVTGLLRPDAGSITVQGVDVWQDPAEAKRAIGVLPDRLRLFDRLTGSQLLYYSGVLRGLDPATVKSRTADLARAFGLDDALGRLVSDYSAGMTKKIALAAALIHSPRVLILDEPFESVDPVSAANVIEILQRYVANGGTVVLSSHGMDLIQRVCDHVAIIVNGQVLAQGSVDEVRGTGTLEERFVELAGGRKAAEGMEWLHSFSD